MLIEWLGHSCFRISQDNYSLVIDPYHPGMIPGLRPLSVVANRVICSHEHDDHNYVQAVKLEKTSSQDPFNIEIIYTYHDNEGGLIRGKNKIALIKSNNTKMAHLGDLGCSLSNSDLAKLKNLDVLMIPVGGHFTIGPKEAKMLCDQINPRIIIPMHYRKGRIGFPMLSEVADFTKLFDKSEVVIYKTSRMSIEKDTKKQVAVLAIGN